MLYLAEEMYLRLSWLPSLHLQLVLLPFAGYQIYLTARSSHLVFILANDLPNLGNLMNNLYMALGNCVGSREMAHRHTAYV
uniref:Uncharacterized protein n=1 Tax=Cannabis sativa TaxID=3483 RepID=A0A803R9L3_CANSA